MIDHREPPALESVESLASLPAPEALPVRRWARDRLTLAAGLACLVLVAVGVLGWLATRFAVSWLNTRDDRICKFADIELDPPPKPWMKSGSRWLLERVQERFGGDAELPMLGVDLERLRDAFRVCPWVEDVRAIERKFPNRLIVRLRYREPVAFIRLNATTIYLDKDGVVLPEGDIDPTREVLLRLVFLEPLDAIPGLPLQARLTIAGLSREPLSAQRIQEATHLARFLKPKRDPSSPTSTRFAIQYLAPLGSHRLCLYVGEGIWVNWGESPGSEPEGTPTAEEKWVMLGDWINRHGVSPLDPLNAPRRWLYFTKSGVEIGQTVSDRAGS